MSVSEVLEKYVAALNSANADNVAVLYADECSFVDGGARPFGFPDVVANGKEGVRNAFAGVFETYKVEAKIVKLNPNSMEYDVELAGLHIPCIGAATCNEDGLITEYIVRPR
ncbi:MAG: hypothetical protein Q4C20_03740 [Erysipelotrichaceae bacterium]|nr:hypothetical protein [Erysipelotrichaceae bacterium]